ncbi:hypothetical protein TWF481_012149 [Arthrobotrys musiformis]|uniref:F-box domain-containing protein n=1 Tax=Arthrobotrys musiformis TaxID=47236 RepID=A0AAV9VXA2_9PEZI
MKAATLRNRISRFFDGLKWDSEAQQEPREPRRIKPLPPHFDPTFPLETLPFDIKYTILKTVAYVDLDGFVSLILASRAYHEVFAEHKRSFTRIALWSDALRYQTESFFLAAVYDDLLDASQDVSKEESERIENGYNAALDPGGCDSEPWYYETVSEGGEEMENRIIRNHIAVRRFANVFIQRAMFPRLLRRVEEIEESRTKKRKNKIEQQILHPEPSRKFGIARSVEDLCPGEPPPTASEREGVMRAIYRLSVYILIFYARIRTRRAIDPTPGTIKCILAWGYWGTKEVEMLIAWLGMEFNPLLYKLFRQGRWWWAWSSLIPSDEDSDAHSGSCSTEPEAREQHYSCSLFALLVHEFPFYATEWIDSFDTEWRYWQPPEDRLGAMTDWTSNFDTRMELGSAHWMMFRLLYHVNYTDYPSPLLELKRICVDGQECFLDRAEYFKIVRFGMDDEFLWGHPERQRVDPWMVLWDDWRLERWGYVLPKLKTREPDHLHS